jgi:hypothetical protein
MFDFLKPKEEESGMKNREPKEDVSEQQQQQQQQQQKDVNFSDDPVDKIFGFFFGQKEEAPMGMKRFGRGVSKNYNFNEWDHNFTHPTDIHYGNNRAVSRAISSSGG